MGASQKMNRFLMNEWRDCEFRSDGGEVSGWGDCGGGGVGVVAGEGQAAGAGRVREEVKGWAVLFNDRLKP